MKSNQEVNFFIIDKKITYNNIYCEIIGGRINENNFNNNNK